MFNDPKKSRALRMILICGAVLAVSLFNSATETEAPGQAVRILTWVFDGCILIGIAASAIRLMKPD
jgi:hypothetical protein